MEKQNEVNTITYIGKKDNKALHEVLRDYTHHIMHMGQTKQVYEVD